MVRHIFGGTTSDYTARVDPQGVQRRVGGIVLDVRRGDTKAPVTDLRVPPDWDGVAFPTGRVVSDRDGDIRFLGPDDFTARLEVRQAAQGAQPPGAWWELVGQPHAGGVVDMGALQAYVDQRIADAALGDVDLSGLVTQEQLRATVDQAVAGFPDTTGLVDEGDARSIADQAITAALAAYTPPPVDLAPYVLRADHDALLAAFAALLSRVEALEEGTTPTDPPADSYSDTYSDVY